MRRSYLLRLRCLIVGVILSTQLNAQKATEMDFTRADSVAALYFGHSLDDVKELSDYLTQPFSDDVEKFRAIYKWVCDNIANDPHNFQKPAQKREKYRNSPKKYLEWNRQFSREVFRRLQRDRKTICTGYASLVKELAYHAGITCRIVDGYGRTAYSKANDDYLPNHSWNAVSLNGQWYLCDATWSSGSINLQEAQFIPEFEEMYFLTEPALFALNHYPLDTAWLLMKKKPDLSAFFCAPLCYKGALRHEVYPIYPENFEIRMRKGDTVSFQFNTTRQLDPNELKMQIVQGSHRLYANGRVNETQCGQYSLTYVFNRKGVYLVHLMYGEEYLTTYSVRVEK